MADGEGYANYGIPNGGILMGEYIVPWKLEEYPDGSVVLTLIGANFLGMAAIAQIQFPDWQSCKDSWVSIGRGIEEYIQGRAKRTPLPEIWHDVANEALKGFGNAD